MNKITIVYSVHWKVIVRSYDGDGLYCYYAMEDDEKIRKVFYKLDDAISYIDSVENQVHPPQLDARYPNEEFEDKRGFYLYARQYTIE